mgnify:CR=1 FL=1
MKKPITDLPLNFASKAQAIEHPKRRKNLAKYDNKAYQNSIMR